MLDMDRPFTIHIEGRGPLRLTPGDFVTAGGEGRIFRRKSLAIKLFDDPARAAGGRMAEKLRLLAALAHPSVVVPEALALDPSGSPAGYVMPWVEDGRALPLAFTSGWRAANGFGDAEALRLAAGMHEATRFVHAGGATMGDANELNVLAVGTAPRYIDVDSWCLPGFPGDRIMPTVRDWHSAPFSQEADWFAWGVVTFQLFTGIHPFRGTHPDFRRTDLEGRMRANASVFDPRVRLSPAVRPFGAIPAPLLDWYRAAFQDGARGVPPDPAAPGVAAARAARPAAAAPPAGGGLRIDSLYGLPAAVLRVAAPDVLLLADGTLLALGTGRRMGATDPAAALVRQDGGAFAAIRIRDGRVGHALMAASPSASMAFQDSGLAAQAAWAAGNRLFAVVADGLLEVQVRGLDGRSVLLPGRKWPLNPNATVLGDGIAVHDALGAKFLAAPFGTAAVAVLRARELDGLTPVALVRRGQVAVLSLLDRAGSYHRGVVQFAADYASCRIALADAGDGVSGDTVTDSGIVARFLAGGALGLEVPASGARREVPAGALAGGMLLSGPSGVFVAGGGRVSKLSLA